MKPDYFFVLPWHFKKEILLRENRDILYKDTIKFIYSRVNLDLASFTSDIWSH